MKTYDEMTQSVLRRAAAGIAARDRRRKTILSITATGLCLALVLAAVVAFREDPAGTRPTISVENPTTAPVTQPEETEPIQQELPAYTGQVYFLDSVAGGVKLTPMQANMTLPVNCMLRVRSLKGLTESEVEEAIAEEYAFRGAFKEKYGNSDGGRYEMHLMTKTGIIDSGQAYSTVIQYLSGGKASLILMDAAQIESFNVETTGVLNDGDGNYITYNKDVIIGEGENAVTIPKGCLRILLFPSMTYETRKIFEDNPDTPLSTISDTITVTIHYKNGTKEIVVIDVTVDDEGQVYMTQRGSNTGV